MRLAMVASLFAIAATAQSDIDPQSMSRLPLIKREQLSGDALRVYDAVVGKDANGKDRLTPPIGPAATSLYSPGVALPMDQLNKYLRNPVVGTAMYQLCTLIAAREFARSWCKARQRRSENHRRDQVQSPSRWSAGEGRSSGPFRPRDFPRPQG
jgi:hypothetical protein